MTSEPPIPEIDTIALVIDPERYRRRIHDWLAGQDVIRAVTDVRENDPGAGLFTGLSVMAQLDEKAHATQVDHFVTRWMQWRGSRPWSLSLAARVSIILAPGAGDPAVGSRWAELMADQRLTNGTALSPRVARGRSPGPNSDDAPGAALLLNTEGPALPVLWHHLRLSDRVTYRPRRATDPIDRGPAPPVTFNIEVEGSDARYWLSGSPDLLLAARPALEGLTAAVGDSWISGIFHGARFGVVTLWARSPEVAETAGWAWELAEVPDAVELRIERSWS